MFTDHNLNSNTGEVLLRPRYFPRQVVTAADLTADQNYFREELRRHNRFLHGCGVVCGLEVLLTSAKQPTAMITAGYALSPQGDEIYIPTDQTFAIACFGSVDDCLDLNTQPQGQRAYLAIRYQETATRAIPALPDRCAPVTTCEFSRLQADFEITCLTKPPGTCLPSPATCNSLLRNLLTLTPPVDRASIAPLSACPPETDQPWVVLAAIDRSADGELSVDYDVRMQLPPTRLLTDIVRCLASPGITAITPDRAYQGATLNAVIAGRGLANAIAVNFQGSGVTAKLLSGNTDTEVPIEISLLRDAPAFSRTFRVTTTERVIDSDKYGVSFTVLSTGYSYPYGYGYGRRNFQLGVGGQLL